MRPNPRSAATGETSCAPRSRFTRSTRTSGATSTTSGLQVRWISPRPCPRATARLGAESGLTARSASNKRCTGLAHGRRGHASGLWWGSSVKITGPSRVIWTNPVSITVQVGACAGRKAWTTSCKASCRWKACHNSTGLGSIASTTAPAVAPTPAPDVAACCLLLLVLLPAAAATPVAAPAAPAPAAPATPAPAAILSNGAPSTPCWCPRKARFCRVRRTSARFRSWSRSSAA